MTERKLATIEHISAITPIPDADQIETVTVRNWQVVVKKGDFKVGDPCVYFEIDSMLPLDHPRYAFLAPRGNRVVDGNLVHVLKTARLRGVYSQGLVLPLADFDGPTQFAGDEHGAGFDLTAYLGIEKYEPPIPADLAGAVAGPFPTFFCKKTDSERIQNITVEQWAQLQAVDWHCTEKIDGTSCTYIMDGDQLRVCGRNWEYQRSEGNTMWRLADEMCLTDSMVPGMAIQGEVFGEGIQSNPLKIKGQRFAAFTVWQDRTVVPYENWPWQARAVTVPEYPTLHLADWTPAELIAYVDGIDSLVSPGRKAEGVVFHARNGERFEFLEDRSNFKVISNKYLLKADR